MQEMMPRPVTTTRSNEAEWINGSLPRKLGKNQRSIDAAERKIIAHHIARRERQPSGWQMVQRGASGVGVSKVQGWCEPATALHFDSPPGFDGAAGA